MSYHNPVLLHESIDALAIKEDGVYVDVTFGGGGHSREILKRLGANGRLFGFDQDPDALEHKQIDNAILLGNSLGGHIALYFTKHYPKKVTALVLTGSSGMYEKAMGDSFPKRGNYEYIEQKAREVFFDPAIATKELVDDVYSTVNDRMKALKTLSIAKSAIRHNMANDLPDMKHPVCLIWGKQDGVTPPEAAEDFHKLLSNSDLFWIDKCGHAAMMEKPEEFNTILHTWLTAKNL